MPMYFPDLESVQQLANQMSKNVKGKEYHGIIPKDESELSQARVELGRYMREVWSDNVAAIEIEQAVTEENYAEKMTKGVLLDMFSL